MTYDRDGLFEQISNALEVEPRIKLSELSTKLGVGRHTVQHVVRTFTGQSFREYQNQVVLSISLQLLSRKPHFTIKEISYRLGYGSVRAFSRFIKKQTGKTPSEMRQATKESSTNVSFSSK